MAIAERAFHWDRLAELVAERLGLQFSLERRADLLRGLSGAAAELGFRDPLELAQQLLGGAPRESQLAVLATHLTIGETYFLRGQETWAALLDQVLPALIRARYAGDKHLRFWSAGCCTGEEPYSLAIVLRQVLPDVDDWQVEIHGTDINQRFLQKAAAGVYGEWSFRGVPADIRRRYFRATGNGSYAIAPEIKRMVRFGRVNLVQDAFPSGMGDHDPFDLILCQNVLMYFTAGQAERVVRKLHGALHEDGWLVVAPCEVSAMLGALFTPLKMGEAILHKRRALPTVAGAAGRQHPSGVPRRLANDDHRRARLAAPLPRRLDTKHADRNRFDPSRLDTEHADPNRVDSKHLDPKGIASQRIEPTLEDPLDMARQWARQGRHDLVADHLLQTQEAWTLDSEGISLLAKALANQGRLAEARIWCERWIAHEKICVPAHYLHAVVLIELGAWPEARAALQRCLYLAPGTPMYSYALANVERRLGRESLAERLYHNALSLLSGDAPASAREDSTEISDGQLRLLVLAALGKDAGDA